MNREQWWKAFAKVLRQMPESVELVIDSNVYMYQAGTHRAHVDTRPGWGIEAPPLESIHHRRVIPYPEGQ